MKKIVGLDILSNAKAAESTLRREEFQELAEALPPGHPLEAEVKQAEAETDGDLSGLPDNHPLVRQLRAAKERYEITEEEDAAAAQEEAEKEAREVRRAKKVDRVKVRRRAIEKEETEGVEQRMAASAVNDDIAITLGAVRKLYATLEGNESVLTRNRMNSARAVRLKRLLFALERGISETTMSRM